MIRKRIVGILGYICFALGVAGVCVWYGFPYTAYVNSRLAEMRSPLVTVVVGEANPLIPMGIGARSVEIACLTMPGASKFLVDGVNLRASLLSYVLGKWKTTMDADLFGGSLKARVTMAPRNMPRELEGTLELQDIGLKGFSPCLRGVDDISGIMEGKVYFSGRMDRVTQGEGNATLSVEKVAAVLHNPLVAGFVITEGSGEARVRMRKGRLEILSCTFESTGIKGTLKGKIVFRAPLVKSTMQLVVTLVADEAIKEQPAGISLIMQPGVTHKINFSGTLEHPRVKLVS